jgi:branched-chain amino acid transport system substrate-binding protein
MFNRSITRRTVLRVSGGVAVTTALINDPIWAADKSVTVGLDLSLTGADAESAKRIEYGAMMAFDNASAAGGVNGYKILVTPYDDGTATAGQYDPAQAATNARRDGVQQGDRGGHRPADERRRQGHGADPQ